MTGERVDVQEGEWNMEGWMTSGGDGKMADEGEKRYGVEREATLMELPYHDEGGRQGRRTADAIRHHFKERDGGKLVIPGYPIFRCCVYITLCFTTIKG